MADLLPQFIRNALQACAPALAQAAVEEVAKIQDSLSVDIEWGPPVIRSEPGEPPRRGTVTHPLYDSVKSSDVEVTDTVAAVAIGAGPVISPLSGQDYAAGLEDNGTEDFARHQARAARPYIRPAQEDCGGGGGRYTDIIVGALRQARP